MFSRLLKFVLIFSVSGLFAWTAPAEEKAEEKKAEGGEAKPEAKSEKKDESAEVQAKVSALQAKIKASEETIDKLIEEKQKTTDQKQISEIIKNMVSEHKTMEKNVEEYEKARSYLQYRFPEKGLKGDRVYERIELKSLEEMENEMTLDAHVKKTLHKVRKQYAAPDAKPTKNEGESEKGKSKKAKEGPSISDPVILTK